MSKVFFFMKDLDTSQVAGENRREASCPTGGYYDKNLGQAFESKRQKRRFLAAHGMRECGELFNPKKPLEGTGGRAIKQRGPRGNFQSRPMPAWMTKEVRQHVG